jgi:NAD(P)-dependent dehydrogenase (short-subunit alcohol dehydrogenase family)
MEHAYGGPMVGRTVLVTRATSGIGRATAALGLATMGAQVAITGRDRGSRCYGQALAARLWEASADLVGLTAAARA